MKRRHHHNRTKKLKPRKHQHVHAAKGTPLFAIRVELFLTDEQKLLVSRLLGCVRLVYNKCLAYNKYWHSLYAEALKRNEEQPGAVPEEELQRLKENCSIYVLPDVLEALKGMITYAFLKDCNQKVLQQSVRHLIKAFEDFFDPKQLNKRHPQFKKKSNDNSCEFNSQAFGGI